MRAKIEQVRTLTDDRLADEEFSTRLEIMNLRFKVSTHQLSDSSQLRGAKRRLSQILTVRRERQLLGGDA
jgi:large subunit ribosomal protein L29